MPYTVYYLIIFQYSQKMQFPFSTNQPEKLIFSFFHFYITSKIKKNQNLKLFFQVTLKKRVSFLNFSCLEYQIENHYEQ